MYKCYLKETDFERIYEFLKKQKRIYGKNRDKTRKFIEGVYFIMRTGSQWEELPKEYGKYKSIHKRFVNWVKKGIWQKLHAHFSKDHDGESYMIDGSVIRAHACASGYEKEGNEKNALGRSKGGFTTKIHAMVDALGLPIKFILTPGQSSEIKQAPELIKDVKNANILADKAFDSDEFIKQIESQNCVPIIPPRVNRKEKREVDYYLYKERHLVECFFSKIKFFRRLFSRFDKLAEAYMGFLAFASTILWLR